MATGPFVQTRRRFLGASAAVTAAIAAGVDQIRGEDADRDKVFRKTDRMVNLGIIGCGREGCWLMTNSLCIPNVRYNAVCDIWPHRRNVAAGICKQLTPTEQYVEPVQYAEYDQFIEEAQKNKIEAVVVAVPDWKHAEVSNACLRGGLHVYCEKEMDKTIEGAREMVTTARETSLILQIGHQRHSNPYYKLAWKLLHHDRVCGRITHARGQFNRNMNGRWLDDAPEFDPTGYGYATMSHLRDWRLYKKHGGGWMADLGSHQIDTLNWMLDGFPSVVMGSAGLDHYTHETDAAGRALPPREWFDSILTMLEYPDRAAGRGMVRVQQQIMTTNAFDEMYEQFMGDEGTLFLGGDGGWVYREEGKTVSAKVEEEKKKAKGKSQLLAAVGRTLRGGGVLDTLQKREQGRRLESVMDRDSLLTKPEHRYALEDFSHSIATGQPPACTPEAAFATTVICVRAGEAALSGQRIDFKPDDFKV